MVRAMTSRAFILAATLPLAFASPASAAISRALLSIAGVPAATGQYVTAFQIHTWGVEFLALCHTLPDWELKIQKYQDPDGMLSGSTDGHGAVDKAGAKALTSLFLVDVYDYQPLPRGDPRSEYHPASFAGWVRMGNDPFGHTKRQSLRATDFKLVKAERCPDPPPPQP